MRAARKHLDSPSGRLLLLLSCVLVFFFAFHAKTAVYQNPSHLDGSTSSKLWLNGGKIESDVSVLDALILWTIALLTFLLRPSRVAIVRKVHPAPVPAQSRKHYLARFLRPPPRF